MDERVMKNILHLIENCRDAVVCSVDENGFPHAKTMFRRKNEGIRKCWFSSNVSSIHVQQWLENPKACVYFSDAKSITGLLLTGYVKVHTDDETKRFYWEEGDGKYYSLGPTDPDYCILCFTAESGNFMAQKKYVFHIDEDIDVAAYTYENGWRKEQ